MSLSWQFDPVLIGGLLALALVYFLLTGPLRPRYAPGAASPGRKVWFFYSATLLLYLAEGSPLHDLAERYSFAAHMLQHLLLSYVVPATLLRGTPEWLLRPLLLRPRVKPVVRVLTHPAVAFSVFNLFFALWHIPVIYEGALRNALVHDLEHVAFFVTALMLWWPLLSPLPEFPRLSHAGAIVYLFLLPIAQLPVFVAITLADYVYYPTYANSPAVMFGDVLADQAFGGALMKVGGLFAFGIPLVFIFFDWYKRENPTHYRKRVRVRS